MYLLAIAYFIANCLPPAVTQSYACFNSLSNGPSLPSNQTVQCEGSCRKAYVYTENSLTGVSSSFYQWYCSNQNNAADGLPYVGFYQLQDAVETLEISPTNDGKVANFTYKLECACVGDFCNNDDFCFIGAVQPVFYKPCRYATTLGNPTFPQNESVLVYVTSTMSCVEEMVFDEKMVTYHWKALNLLPRQGVCGTSFSGLNPDGKNVSICTCCDAECSGVRFNKITPAQPQCGTNTTICYSATSTGGFDPILPPNAKTIYCDWGCQKVLSGFGTLNMNFQWGCVNAYAMSKPYEGFYQVGDTIETQYADDNGWYYERTCTCSDDLCSGPDGFCSRIPVFNRNCYYFTNFSIGKQTPTFPSFDAYSVPVTDSMYCLKRASRPKIGNLTYQWMAMSIPDRLGDSCFMSFHHEDDERSDDFCACCTNYCNGHALDQMTVDSPGCYDDIDNTTAIILGVVFGVLALILIAAVVFYAMKKKKARRAVENYGVTVTYGTLE